MSEKDDGGQRAVDIFPAGTEVIVAAVVLIAIFLLSVYTDPLRPGGHVVSVPFAALVATYLLAFQGLARRPTKS